MSNEIQKFDPSTLMQGVKDRIKSEFVSLIPDDQWSEMIKKEADLFFQTKETGYINKTYASDFGILVRDELRKECQSRLNKYLSSPEFQSIWDNNGQKQCSEAVKKLIVENSGVILQNMFGGMFTVMLNDFSAQLRNRQY